MAAKTTAGDKTTDKRIQGCTVQSCSCKSAFQDATYGKGMRVKNMCGGGYRCTVCGVDNKTLK